MVSPFIDNNRTGMTVILVSSYVIFAALMIILNVYILKDHNVVAQSIPVLSPSFNSSYLSSSTTNTSNTHTLSVIGSATTNLKPDKVLLNLGIQTTNKTAKEALAANSDIMNKVINALRAEGAKDNETSTSSFTISPNYNNSKDLGTIRNISSFTVSNSIQVQSSNLNNTAKWIDSAIAAGANNVNGVVFSLSDKRLQETKNFLIKEAINNARNKAEIAAKELGLKITGVKSIDFNELNTTPPGTMLDRQESLAAPALTNMVTTPIIPGQQQVSATVSVVFLIA
jgi:uncharacterized protein YggE